MSEKREKVKIYPRSSSTVEEGEGSIAAQTELLTEFANSVGYKVTPEDVLPEVDSGATLDRPQLDKLRRMAAAGEFDALFVYSADRLSRDPADLLVVVREFNSHGVEVHIAHAASDSTP